MIKIDDLEAWTKTYFEQPENVKKAEKACERYDRLMVTNIRRQLTMGSEQININELAQEDPGKRLEKVKFETISNALFEGEKGKIRVNLIDQTAEFIPGKK